MKKNLNIIMCMCLIIVILAGCGVSNKTKEVEIPSEDVGGKANQESSQEKVIDANTPMGRYTETDITPAEIQHASNINFSKNKEDQFLLSVYDNDKEEPRGFIYQDNSWTEQNNSKVVEFLKGKEPKEIEVISDYAGNWWVFLKEDQTFNTSYKIGKDGSVIELEIPESIYISQLLVGMDKICLQAGDSYTRECIIFDIESGESTTNSSLVDIGFSFHLQDNYIFLKSKSDEYRMYDLDKGHLIENYEMPVRDEGFSLYTLDVKEEEFVFVDSEGIHKREKEGTIIQTIVSDTGFAFADPRRTGNSTYFKTFSEEDNYIFVDTFNVSELKVLEYKFDETVPTNKSESLSIWALDNIALSAQVAMFSQEYPDVQVEFLSEEIYLPVEDFAQPGSLKKAYDIYFDEMIKKINTKLLAGEAPDIICLDGLSIEALKNKGMLSKLELEIDESEYYEKILNTYSDEEGVYAYPTKFYTYLFASVEPKEIEASNTMENIVTLYEEPTNIDYGFIFQLYFYPNFHKIFPDYKTVDEIVLKDFLNQTKNISESIKQNKLDEDNGFSFGRSLNVASEVSSIYDSSKLFASHENVEVIPLLEGTYVNQTILAIPTDAKNKELAEKFILTSLGDDCVTSLDNGFSVKKDIELDKVKQLISTYEISSVNTESSDVYNINVQRNVDMLAVDWEELLESLKYGCQEDYILYNIVEEGAEIFYEDSSMGVDEAVANIMNKLEILFAERN